MNVRKVLIGLSTMMLVVFSSGLASANENCTVFNPFTEVPEDSEFTLYEGQLFWDSDLEVALIERNGRINYPNGSPLFFRERGSSEDRSYFWPNTNGSYSFGEAMATVVGQSRDGSPIYQTYDKYGRELNYSSFDGPQNSILEQFGSGVTQRTSLSVYQEGFMVDFEHEQNDIRSKFSILLSMDPQDIDDEVAVVQIQECKY
ncbi:MAG: hypothetical protein AB8E15_12395 [Bdellovibrionales bacterium]